MAIDRSKLGLVVLRVSLGILFLAQGLSKLRWFLDPSLLDNQLGRWTDEVASNSFSARYLERVALPFAWIFARLVPLGEISTGIALIAGRWIPVFALIGFAMVVNFHIASGVMFKLAYLANGYGPPVLGGTLALALMTRMKR